MKTRRHFLIDSMAAIAAIVAAPLIASTPIPHVIKLGLNGNLRRYTRDCFAPFLGAKIPVFMQDTNTIGPLNGPNRSKPVGEITVEAVLDDEVRCSMRISNEDARRLIDAGAVPCSAGTGRVQLVAGMGGPDFYDVKDFQLTGFFLSNTPA